MSELHDFIDQHSATGAIESEGSFTLNPAQAFEKLAKFQLVNRREFILKFIQAGNLAAQTVDIKFGKRISVWFEGWDPDIDLHTLFERFGKLQWGRDGDPLFYLLIGLITLSKLTTEEILLTQRVKDQQGSQTLVFSQTASIESLKSPPSPNSYLEISWPSSAHLNPRGLKELVEKRCAFSRIPVLVNGEPIIGVVPQPSGKHRVGPAENLAPFFRNNVSLASAYYTPKDPELATSAELPNFPDPLPPTVSQSDLDRTLFLKITVDLDPTTTIHLMKANVIMREKRLNIGVPGLVAVVSADDVPTDLTGSQFMEGQEMTHLTAQLRECAQRLLPKAVEGVQDIHVYPPRIPIGIVLLSSAIGLIVTSYISPIPSLFLRLLAIPEAVANVVSFVGVFICLGLLVRHIGNMNAPEIMEQNTKSVKEILIKKLEQARQLAESSQRETAQKLSLPFTER